MPATCIRLPAPARISSPHVQCTGTRRRSTFTPFGGLFHQVAHLRMRRLHKRVNAELFERLGGRGTDRADLSAAQRLQHRSSIPISRAIRARWLIWIPVVNRTTGKSPAARRRRRFAQGTGVLREIPLIDADAGHFRAARAQPSSSSGFGRPYSWTAMRRSGRPSVTASSSRHVFGSGAISGRRQSHFAQGGDRLGAARNQCYLAQRIGECGFRKARRQQRFNWRVPTPVSSTTMSNSPAKRRAANWNTASLSATGISRIEGATNGCPPGGGSAPRFPKPVGSRAREHATLQTSFGDYIGM